MTYNQAVKVFQEMYVDLYKREADYWKAQEAWAEYVDNLCKTGEITQKQYDTWKTPFTYGKPLKMTKRFSR